MHSLQNGGCPNLWESRTTMNQKLKSIILKVLNKRLVWTTGQNSPARGEADTPEGRTGGKNEDLESGRTFRSRTHEGRPSELNRRTVTFQNKRQKLTVVWLGFRWGMSKPFHEGPSWLQFFVPTETDGHLHLPQQPGSWKHIKRGVRQGRTGRKQNKQWENKLQRQLRHPSDQYHVSCVRHWTKGSDRLAHKPISWAGVTHRSDCFPFITSKERLQTLRKKWVTLHVLRVLAAVPTSITPELLVLLV